MTTTTVDEMRAAVEALLTDTREAVTVIHPANAAALNKGPAGLMVSAAVVLTCDGCAQNVRFDGSRVEGYFLDDGLVIEAEWSRQHGCGTWAPPIVWVTWPAGDDLDPEALVAELRRLTAEAQGERNEATARRLRRELTEFLALPEDDREATGTDWEPGIYHNGERWIAWDYDTRPHADATWDTIDVTEADVAAETGR